MCRVAEKQFTFLFSIFALSPFGRRRHSRRWLPSLRFPATQIATGQGDRQRTEEFKVNWVVLRMYYIARKHELTCLVLTRSMNCYDAQRKWRMAQPPPCLACSPQSVRKGSRA